MAFGRAAPATLLALLLCLPGPGAAEALAQATFQAAAASWDSETPVLAGGFVALSNRLPATKNSAAVADSWFEIQAKQLHVEIDVADAYAETPAVASPIPPYSGYTNRVDFSQAVVTGVASRADRFLNAYPLGDGAFQVGAGCGEARPYPRASQPVDLPGGSDPDQIRSEPHVDSPRPTPTADVSDTLVVATCPDTPLTLRGSFLVVLWEWDAQVEAKDGALDIWSGTSRPMQPLDGDVAYAGGAQQAYLYVWDGVLTMRGNAERPSLIYLDQLSMRGLPLLLLQDARGRLGDASLSGGQVQFAGEFDAGLTPTFGMGAGQAAFVTVNLGGNLQFIEIDGRRTDLASESTVVVPTPSRALGSTATVLLAAFALAVGWALRHRIRPARVGDSASSCAEMARHDLQQGKLPRALRHVSRAVRLAPDVPSYRVLRSVILQECARRTGRQEFLREAGREEAKLNRDLADPQERALTHAEATDLLCGLGRREEALQALRLAADEDVGVVVQNLANGSYRLLWDEPWVRALRGTPQSVVFLDPAFS